MFRTTSYSSSSSSHDQEDDPTTSSRCSSTREDDDEDQQISGLLTSYNQRPPYKYHGANTDRSKLINRTSSNLSTTSDASFSRNNHSSHKNNASSSSGRGMTNKKTGEKSSSSSSSDSNSCYGKLQNNKKLLFLFFILCVVIHLTVDSLLNKNAVTNNINHHPILFDATNNQTKKQINNHRHYHDNNSDTTTNTNDNNNYYYATTDTDTNNNHHFLDHLIIVAGHSILIPTRHHHLHDAHTDEEDWVLLDYQKDKNIPSAIIKQIQRGIQECKDDPNSLLVFSGGPTRKGVGPYTEASSYFHVADSMNLWSSSSNSSSTASNNSSASTSSNNHNATHNNPRDRTITEEFATDSLQNFLYSICRFYEYSNGMYPKKITIISFAFKKYRFQQMHAKALRWPVPNMERTSNTTNTTTTITSANSGSILQNNNDNNNSIHKTTIPIAAAASSTVEKLPSLDEIMKESLSNTENEPSSTFQYIGIDPPPSSNNTSVSSFDLKEAFMGEYENSIKHFQKDPYGCYSSTLRDKRIERNPYNRRSPYELSCPDMKAILNYCGPQIISKSLVPWAH